MKIKTAFTLIEILIVIAILAILASLILPVVSRFREQGYSAQCKNNLKQMGLAFQMYESDAGRLPVAWNGNETNAPANVILPYGNGVGWAHRLLPYLKDRRLYECPSTPDLGKFGGYTSYAINLNVTNMSSNAIIAPSQVVLCFDEHYNTAYSYNTALLDIDGARHQGKRNCLFVDGHVKPLLPMEANPFCPTPAGNAYTMCPS